jgi:hypothetical protein
VALFYSIVNVLLKLFSCVLLGTRFATRFWDKTVANRISRKRSGLLLFVNTQTKLFAGRDLDSSDDFFLAVKTIQELCFAGLLGGTFDEIRRAADLGDAFAQAWMAVHTDDEDECFRWAENLLLKKNAMVFSGLGIATAMEVDARKTWKEQ